MSSEQQWKRHGDLVALLVCSLLFVAQSILCHLEGGTIDDAFISYRYAENLANGHGLVFNPGKDAVEGYSNFLWVVILSSFFRAGFDSIWTSKVLGVASGIGIFGLVVGLGRRLQLSLKGRVWVLLLLSTAPTITIYAISGLETLFYTFLFTVFLYGFIREEGLNPALGFPVSGLLAGLFSLTRPEGFIIFFGFVVYRLVECWFWQKKLWFFIKWLAGFLIIFIPFLFWRYYSYGLLLPMSVYAKVMSSSIYRGVGQILGGINYLYAFLRNYGGGLPLVLFVVFCQRVYRIMKLRCTTRIRIEEEDTVLVFFVSIVWFFFYCINVGGDWMPQFRFYVPILPVVYLTVVFTSNTLSDVHCWSLRLCDIICLSLLSFNIIQLVPTLGYTSSMRRDSHIQYCGIRDSDMLTIEAIELGHKFRGKTLATTECGVLPYYSQLTTIDMMGLNDRTIGMIFHNNKYGGEQSDEMNSPYRLALKYVLDLKPDLIFYQENSGYHPVIRNSDVFTRNYVRLQGFSLPFFVRRDSAVPAL